MKTRHKLLRILMSFLVIPALALGIGGLFGLVVEMSGGNYALAATDANVTVNATPAYVSISNNTSAWVMNGITGGGAISTNTTYYANPQGDTTPPSATVQADECHFEITNTSTVNIDLTVNCSNFSGGNANMTNGNTGSNGATSYGGYSYYEGLLLANAVIMKTAASTALKTNHSGDLKWGAYITTQTDAWGGSSTSQATMTISAQAT